MSMVELGKHHRPKGSITSPIRLCIVGHLEHHGERSTLQVVEALLAANLVSEEELATNPTWVQSQLAKLRVAKHIVKRENSTGIVWAVRPAADEPETPDPDVVRRLAGPRQVSKMAGPAYTPPPLTPARPGAMDFARAHSLMGTTRVPFRGAP